MSLMLLIAVCVLDILREIIQMPGETMSWMRRTVTLERCPALRRYFFRRFFLKTITFASFVCSSHIAVTCVSARYLKKKYSLNYSINLDEYSVI